MPDKEMFKSSAPTQKPQTKSLMKRKAESDGQEMWEGIWDVEWWDECKLCTRQKNSHWNEHVFQRRESITYRLETLEGMGRANGLY